LPAYLQAAERRLKEQLDEGRVRLVEGDVNRLPFADGALNAIGSFHSMQSYPDIPHVLGEFHRALKPGGVLAILETDNIHSIMLSWPPDLELSVRQAEHHEIGSEDSYVGTYFPRFAPRLVEGAGFTEFMREYVFIHRQQPSEALEQYIELYLKNLIESVGERLSEANLERLKRLADRDSKDFLPRRPNFFFGSLQVLMLARAGGQR
jgi:ubiquinone/menaquinone biosynthesis C-methylase UbiE